MYQKIFFAKAEKVIALGDMTLIVKLKGLNALTTCITAGIAVSGAGVGIVKGGLIIADGIGIDVDIRRGFLGSPEQSC